MVDQNANNNWFKKEGVNFRMDLGSTIVRLIAHPHPKLEPYTRNISRIQ